MRFITQILIIFMSLGSSIGYSQTATNKYAQECARAIGGDIPKFRCDEGEIITINTSNTSNASDTECENPAYLSSVGSKACIKKSRFQKLTPINIRQGFNSNDIEIRLLCRHYELPSSNAVDTLFDDIAIIATNIKNGATCFFQSDVGPNADHDGNNVLPPSDPNHNLFKGGAGGCVGCHAIRPFIETPYLASVSPANKIRNIMDFPKDKYWFPGEPNLVIYRSLIPGQETCTRCHNIASTSSTSYSGEALEIAHQSIGLSNNPNVNRSIPYMTKFAPFDVARAALTAHESCYTTGSNCTIQDISNPARLQFERDHSVPTPSTTGSCGPNQTWNPSEGRCVDNSPNPGSGSKIDVNKVYTFVASHSGKCLDARGGSPENGTVYQQFDCNGQIDQSFRFVNVKDDEYEIRAVNGGRCVSSAGGKTENGNPMILWDCGGGSDQHVRLLPAKSGAYKVRFSNSGKCMDIQGDSSSENGKDVHQWDCGENADQAWFLRVAGGAASTPPPSSDKPFDGKMFTLVASHSNKCLDARGGSPENGTVYQQFECNGEIDQKFRLINVKDDEYELRAVNGGRCVSSAGGKTENGNPMILWDCGGGPDQHVRLLPAKNGAYKVRFSNSGKCMDIQGESSSENGKDVHQWDCGDNADQAWFLRETW
ncbi:MAG: RICIN domain-containing protein [Oligoflexus sp.]|nr:RICIN domain-containing protein [Oligoflexus sp.]